MTMGLSFGIICLHEVKYTLTSLPWQLNLNAHFHPVYFNNPIVPVVSILTVFLTLNPSPIFDSITRFFYDSLFKHGEL